MRGRDRSGKQTDGAITRPLILLGITVLIDLLGFGIVLPNLPQYIELAAGTDHRHAAFVGSLLAASYSLTQFIFAPLWGRYSDRVGRRPVLLLSMIGFGASCILFGLAGKNLALLFAARLLAGFLSSASIGVAFAYVADVTPPEKRAQGLGLLGACFGLGFMLGPFVGGTLGHISLPLPAFVAAGLSLVNFFFSLRYLPESLTAEQRQKALGEGPKESTLRLMGRVVTGPAAFLFFLTFVITFGFSALEQTFSFYLLATPELGISPKDQPLYSGIILGIAGLIGIIVQGGLIGPLVARFGEAAIARVGLFLMIIGFGFFTVPKTLLGLILVPVVFFSAGRAMTAPALSALISRKANLGQGLTLSASQSFDALARTVGPIIAGTLFDRFGPGMPYHVAAVTMSLALLVTLIKARDMTTPVNEGHNESYAAAPVNSTENVV
jgi:multidrug resistance protein